MNKFDKANRIARAIFFHGIGSLSSAEENILSIDNEFSRAVFAIVEKLKRNSYLENNRSYSLDISSEYNESSGHIIWEFEGFEYHADVQINSKTNKANLELKKYYLEDYNNTMNIGSHEMVGEVRGDSGFDEDFRSNCIVLLKKHGCPIEKISTVFK